MITTSREYVDHKLDLVADADGAVYSALLATQLPRFRPYVYLTPAFSPPRWMLLVQENQTWTSGGCLFGTTARVAPTGTLRWSGNRSTVVGDLGVLEFANGFTTSAGLLDFDSGSHVANISSSLPMSFEWMFADNVFWQGNSGRVATVGQWRPDAGATDFINYGFDPNHAAGSLGTDGHDMVWVEAQGNPTDAGLWTTAAYFTSPYTADKSQILPRRLRSASTQALGFTRIAVGCGYAVATFAERAIVIRISDGWAWFLAGWAWQAPLAVTCNEAFFRVGIPGPLVTIARVALSQLGAGEAPD